MDSLHNEQMINLALLEIDLDKTIYIRMTKNDLKRYLSVLHSQILELNNKKIYDKFLLSSRILLNDTQTMPMMNCMRGTSINTLYNPSDRTVNYKTDVYEKALIDPKMVVNSNVTEYIDKFNPETFNPKFSDSRHPFDTINYINYKN